jgi:hypothetical protein
MREVFSEYFGFPCKAFHQLLHILHHPSFGAGNNRPYTGRRTKWTQSHSTPRNLNKTRYYVHNSQSRWTFLRNFVKQGLSALLCNRREELNSLWLLLHWHTHISRYAGNTQKNGAVSKVDKMYFLSYMGTSYTVSSENCPSFLYATSSSLLMLTTGPRDQFPRWRRSRIKLSVLILGFSILLRVYQ